jgi:5'-nucleotidase
MRAVRGVWWAVVAVLCLSARVGAAPRQVRFTILHTNDMHGRLLPFTYAEDGRGGIERGGVGGAANRATVIRALRREIKAPTILVDAGDVFTRGALTNAYEGVTDIAAMNACGYDLAAVGNNEFKAKDAADQQDAAGSQAALLRVVRRSRFPWLCANLLDGRGRPPGGMRPYVVRRMAGLRVGFLGLTAPRSAAYPQTRGWTISDPIEAARVWAPRVRAVSDVVVALTHIGYDLDRALAQTVPGLDVIVGGDSHTFLYEPQWVPGPSGTRVPIVQAGEYGVNVGRLDLVFESEGGHTRLSDAQGRLVPVSAGVRADRAVERAIAPYVRPFLRPVARMDVSATSEASVGATTRVVVEALLRAAGAELAMNPAGDGLTDVLRGPVVRRYDVYAAMPFRNLVVTALLTGAEIAQLRRDHPTTMLAGAAGLDAGRTYRVAFVDFVAQNVYRIPSVRLLSRGPDVREAVEAHLRATATLQFIDSGSMQRGPSLAGLLTYRDTGYASMRSGG